MDRRTFLAVSGAAGVAPLVEAAAYEATQAGRDFVELQQYQLDTEAQKAVFDKYVAQAAIPALNRLGVKPVGVFYPLEGISPAYVVLRHPNAESAFTLVERLMADAEFTKKGAELLNAPAEAPAFKRVESAFLLAFTGMPHMERPVANAERVFQLRIYESPSAKTNLKKIEMFNTAEIAIFRRVGLNPVFFGRAVAGTKMPNLTYMLAFKDAEEQKVNWQKFRSDPEWQVLRAKPEYADKAILCGITNILLKPADYSQF